MRTRLSPARDWTVCLLLALGWVVFAVAVLVAGDPPDRKL